MKLSTNRLFLYRFIGYLYWFNVLVFWLLGYGYLKAILGSGTLFFNELHGYLTWWGKGFALFFAVVNYLSYMAFLAFFPAILLFIIATVLPSKRLIAFLATAFAFLSVIFLLADSKVYAMFKFHLNSVLLSMLFSRDLFAIFKFSLSEFLAIFAIIILVLMFEIAIANFIWRKNHLFNKGKHGKLFSLFCLGGLFFSYFSLVFTLAASNSLLSQQTANLPFFSKWMGNLIPYREGSKMFSRYSELNFTQPLFPRAQFNYPLSPVQCTPPKNPYNIILIMVDTLRADHLNKERMPNLGQFADKNWQFLNHFSGGNSTQAGLFSLFYSIPNNYWTAALEQKTAPVFNNLLKQYQYQSQVIWSSNGSNPPYHKTIYLGIENISFNKDYNFDHAADDRRTTEKVVNFLENPHLKKPFFLNVFYDAVHAYCGEQSYATEPEFQKECFRLLWNANTDPEPIQKRYLSAVNFMDGELAKVLFAIEKGNYLDNSIVIITSDHGEEFNDSKQNFWGHASNFTKYQVQAPLVVHWPQSPARKITHFTSHYDIIPTLLDYWQCKNAKTDYSIGQNLLQEDGRLAFHLVGSYANAGIIEANHSITLQTSGGILVSDLEGKPLPRSEARVENIKQALDLMRRYFQ